MTTESSLEHKLDLAAMCYLIDHKAKCKLTQSQVKEITGKLNAVTRESSPWDLMESLEVHLVSKYVEN